jgi:hypothetical protein
MLKGDDGTNAETMAAVVHNCLRWASQDQDGKRVGLPLDLVSEKDQTVVVMLAAVGLEMIIEDTFQFPPWGAEEPPLVEPGRLDPKHLPAGHKDKPSDR